MMRASTFPSPLLLRRPPLARRQGETERRLLVVLWARAQIPAAEAVRASQERGGRKLRTNAPSQDACAGWGEARSLNREFDSREGREERDRLLASHLIAPPRCPHLGRVCRNNAFSGGVGHFERLPPTSNAKRQDGEVEGGRKTGARKNKRKKQGTKQREKK
jgi:hypothetical protein